MIFSPFLTFGIADFRVLDFCMSTSSVGPPTTLQNRRIGKEICLPTVCYHYYYQMLNNPAVCRKICVLYLYLIMSMANP